MLGFFLNIENVQLSVCYVMLIFEKRQNLEIKVNCFIKNYNDFN